MDLQTRKLSFIQDFLRLQNEEIIYSLENLLKKQNIELFEKKLKPMSVDKFQHEIDNAINDSYNDKVIKSSDLKDKYK